MSHTELREPTFYVLTALAGGRRHGYALIEEVAELSGGRLRLRPGTLYAVDGEETVGGRLRRYFTLTDDGGAALAEHALRMQGATAVALGRLRLRGGLA
jgi:PadR family transcriptional regulator PadR